MHPDEEDIDNAADMADDDDAIGEEDFNVGGDEEEVHAAGMNGKANGKAAHEREFRSSSSSLTVRIPTDPTKFNPPPPADEISQATELLRDAKAWSQLCQFWQMIGGEMPSVGGNRFWDNARMVFRARELAASKGLTLLASLNDKRLSFVLKRALTRVSDITYKQLESQNKRLRLEWKEHLAQQAKAAE